LTVNREFFNYVRNFSETFSDLQDSIRFAFRRQAH